ncbi:MAG: GNAT family N-acetyltransferase [Oscillospiraceae bacterium]|nr:GNAT family N-acetyltransferase [Oscillospiraceae bacterium]
MRGDIRYARAGDDLRPLWRLCFGESGETFFGYSYSPERCLLVEDDDGAPLAMLHYLPRQLCIGGEEIPAAYALGVCAHPEHRGRGYASDLMEQLFFELHLRKVPLCCVLPQPLSNARFYERFGFARPSAKTLPPDPALLARYYGQLMAQRPHLRRTEADWAAMTQEYRVEMTASGYAVYDGDTLMESYNTTTACFKVIEGEYIRSLALRLGYPPLPRDVKDECCPWNDTGGAASLDEAFFANTAPYVNLLYN